MFLLILPAIGGGIATGLGLLSYGVLPAVLLAPVGGSVTAMLAAGYVASRRESIEKDSAVNAGRTSRPDDLDAGMDAHADAMVSALRGVAARAKASDRDVREAPATDAGKRHVA